MHLTKHSFKSTHLDVHISAIIFPQAAVCRRVCAGTRPQSWVSVQPGGNNAQKAPARARVCNTTCIKTQRRHLCDVKRRRNKRSRAQPKHKRADVPHVARSRQPNERRTLLILCHLNEHVRMRLWAKMLICTTVKDLGDRIQRFDYNRRGVVYRFHTRVKKNQTSEKTFICFILRRLATFYEHCR